MPKNSHHLPRLRPIDVQQAQQDGRRLLVLRDPLQVSENMVAMPIELAPLLALCDGTRDAGGLRSALAARYGLKISPQVVDRFLDVMDDAFLLDNDRFHVAHARLLADYRAAPYRTPALAGLSYPADPDELTALFQGYGAAAAGQRGATSGGAVPGRNGSAGVFAPGTPAGIISPHIDYQRGGPVYAAVWSAAAEQVRRAEIAIVFGTDHYGGPGEITLTRQSYATPFGVLPNPEPMVDALARALGGERAFASELHHRSEHSVELAVTWLHYTRRDLPVIPVLPILCGSFHRFIEGQGHPDGDTSVASLVHTLAELTSGKRTLVVAGADLSHVGPAFGGEPQGPVECSRVQAADAQIIERACAGDARGFFETIRAVGDRNNICGLSPIYLTLRTLDVQRGLAPSGDAPAGSQGEAAVIRGRQIAYATCPADDAGTSFVSISGAVLE